MRLVDGNSHEFYLCFFVRYSGGRYRSLECSMSGKCDELTVLLRLTAAVLIRTVCAIPFAVAEKSALDAVTITAGQKTILAQRLVGVQQWLHLALLVLQLAVLDGIFPITCLLFNVEKQTGWASDSLQTLKI